MRFFVAVLWALLLPATTLAADLPAEWRAALEGISGASLKGHVSFLASDALQGRDTPSPGLDAAAAYIASRFRAAGLQPATGDTYFQIAKWKLRSYDPALLDLTLDTGSRIIRAAGIELAADASEPVTLSAQPATVYRLEDAAELDAGAVRGKVIAVMIPDLEGLDSRKRRSVMMSYRRFSRSLGEAHPALVVIADSSGRFFRRRQRPKLIDPADPPPPSAPSITVADPVLVQALSAALDKGAAVRISASIPEPRARNVELKNVLAVLPGSDPALKKTAVMLTAHYDHVGVCGSGEGDRICNGANDDASGTAAVIEIAEAFATLRNRPKRSIMFLTFFGEEKGGLGSKYYARHPVFPLCDTVADLNLEQVGRTDATEGRQLRTVSLTGIDYSEVGAIMRAAGAATGIKVYKHPRNDAAYFTASDNISLARKGVPAHSVTVAFQYPDYHGVGDHWDKIDYENMAAVTRTIAAGLLFIADRDEPPHWDAANSRTEPYRKAREECGSEPK